MFYSTASRPLPFLALRALGKVGLMLVPRFRLILASGSPRRRELLSGLVSEFEIEVPEVDEDAFVEADPWRTALRLAGEKAAAIRSGDAIILGADTVVAVPSPGGWIQLAKPANDEDAARMLRVLSGQRHAVITGVALRWPNGHDEWTETSYVTFRDLSEPEIAEYIATGEPMDKAGAYAIQGGAAGFVTKVEGFVSTVIGFPIEEIEQRLLSHGLVAI